MRRARVQGHRHASPRVTAPRRPSPQRVAALARRLHRWHGGELRTALGQLRRAEVDVDAEDPFEVLIGTLLSHRTRDERTYPATRALFQRWPTASALSHAKVAEVRDVLREGRVGFYNVKAPRVVEVARLVAEQRGGNVPDTMEGLLALPGVGRKTAACVLVYGFGKPAIPVDTHVHRISNRLGLVRTRDPEATEAALARVLPPREWLLWNELLVSFGKAVCKPVGPRCAACPLEDLCPSSRVRR